MLVSKQFSKGGTMILFEIPNEKGEIVQADVFRIMQMIENGQIWHEVNPKARVYSVRYEEWYGTLTMFLNRFQSLYVEDSRLPLTHNAHFVPITMVYKPSSEVIQDRIEEFNEEMHNRYVVLNASGLH